MGNKSSRSSGKECPSQKFFDRLPEIKAELCLSGDSANHGVSLELIDRFVSLIKDLNRQSMEPRPFAPPGLWKDELLSPLKEEFLHLSVDLDKFLDTLLTNMKNMTGELREVLVAIVDWTPSRHRQEEMLKKLKQFQSSESFSEQFLQSFRDLVEQHHVIVKLVQQTGASLEKEVKKLKWLRKVIYTTFVGFFVAVLICSIVAAALHASPLLASVVAAASSAASWGPLALWVDELWVKKLNGLRFVEKGLGGLREGAGVDRERVLRELKPIFSLVNELKQGLNDVHSSEELCSMKERLQNELCVAIDGVNDAIEKVEDCKTELDGSRNKLLNWMTGGGKGAQSGQSKILLGS